MCDPFKLFPSFLLTGLGSIFNGVTCVCCTCCWSEKAVSERVKDGLQLYEITRTFSRLLSYRCHKCKDKWAAVKTGVQADRWAPSLPQLVFLTSLTLSGPDLLNQVSTKYKHTHKKKTRQEKLWTFFPNPFAISAHTVFLIITVPSFLDWLWFSWV